MRALITGGASFIGSHLADFLIARGETVAVIDDLRTGALDDIAHLAAHPRFTCHVDSLRNRALMSELIDGCDVVFHLATAVETGLAVESPVQTITNTFAGTQVVLEAAAKARRKVLLTSAAKVYGARADRPFREGDAVSVWPPAGRGWSFACAKAADEFLALAYWEEYRLPVIVARLFDAVGAHSSGSGETMIAPLVEAALAGAPIAVPGDGREPCCFAYVEDVARVLVGLAEHPDAVGQIINVGNDQEISIGALAAHIKARVGSSSEIVMLPAAGNGSVWKRRRVPDLSKVNGLLADPPRTSLNWVLDTLIQHARARRRIAASVDTEIVA